MDPCMTLCTLSREKRMPMNDPQAGRLPKKQGHEMICGTVSVAVNQSIVSARHSSSHGTVLNDTHYSIEITHPSSVHVRCALSSERDFAFALRRARPTSRAGEKNVALIFNYHVACACSHTPWCFSCMFQQMISLSVDDWVVATEVTFLMIIIVGRWLLPKGKITRSALSQLLLVYLSLASDMIDLLSIFQEDQVIRSSLMVYAILIVFSWSTFQFCLNLVATRGRNFHAEPDEEPQVPTISKVLPRPSEIIPIKSVCQKLYSSELPSIFITILMQDLPFLVLRLIAVIHFKVQSYTTIFFTCKNLFILFLQFYRLWSICMEHVDQEETEEPEGSPTPSKARPLRESSDAQLI